MLGSIFIFLSLWTICSFPLPNHGVGVGAGTHLPIRYTRTRKVEKRSGKSTAIGLGDVLDVTYNVVVQVGDTKTPVVLDTGSADLWIVSNACPQDCAAAGVPLYPQNALRPTGQDVRLMYGDSRTGTHASGPIGMDTVGIAGLAAADQCFAAIVDTNTTVLDTGSAGILGLGFAGISVIWRQLLSAQLNQSVAQTQKRSMALATDLATHDFSTRSVADLRRPQFPSFDFIYHAHRPLKRDTVSMPLASAAAAIDSFSTFGPLLTRLITRQELAIPMIVITLQRDTLMLGGDAGLLSLGALPPGVQFDQLTWVPVRAYSPDEGGLPPSPQAPDEVYPLVWEIALDDVFFDGVKLSRSTISTSNITLSALVDTGNSLIRGPQDVISHIISKLGGPAGSFDCAVPHNLSFLIGGSLFSVDPRDFAHPASSSLVGDTVRCIPALAATDPPGNGGFLYSWSLGDPFLKSALIAFYYGNITHPSRDPPRVGLLSTVPSNAGDELEEAVQAAVAAGGIFPSTSDVAPLSAYVATATGCSDVPQATHPGDDDLKSSNAASACGDSGVPIPLIILIRALDEGMNYRDSF
ncbi:Cathepsin E [Grifola frondosa]|uniref:Cathepsin E n=1 Tax=Grifola frondosa TaxID=5627 RepID=A0A1C7MNQ6_GRIFR|nr:Cathepsin E [Grifola frondosa]